ncbi:MAG: ribbon-helix-helix protein, CopG family [Tepidisphaeraceae bacterium]|jgi:uncharacterized protein (DUF4415 family)
MKTAKPYTQMSAAELAEATKQYDAMVIDKTRPLNSKERKLWEQAKRGRGRPKIGKGAKKVSISLENDLLRKADAIARKRGLNRSELIAGFVMDGLKRKAV